MRYSTAFTVVSTLLPLAIASPILPDTSLTRPYRRQLLSANICAVVDIDVPITVQSCTDATGAVVSPIGLTAEVALALGVTCTPTGDTSIDIAPDVCICLQDGLLTTDSLNNLEAAIDVNGPILALTLPYAGNDVPLFASIINVIDSVINGVIADVGSGTTTCNYPVDGTPNSCTACTFDCPTGEEACGTQCVAEGTVCVSGIPQVQRRRGQYSMTPNQRCPGQLSACAIPNSKFFNGENFECIDTTSDLESCGACAFPLPGQEAGQDCTAIPHALSVDCQLGKCIVNSCERGYEIQGGNTTCVAQTIEEYTANWKKDQESVAKRQVNTQRLRSRIHWPSA